VSYPDRPHISFPFQRDASGSVRVVEQNSVEHVMSCELVIVHHPIGYRHDRPEFGWAWPELASAPLDLGSLERALKQFEPRGTASAVQYADVAQAAVQHISVDVAIESVETED
jgi:phage baseplate assembly protein W